MLRPTTMKMCMKMRTLMMQKRMMMMMMRRRTTMAVRTMMMVHLPQPPTVSSVDSPLPSLGVSSLKACRTPFPLPNASLPSFQDALRMWAGKAGLRSLGNESRIANMGSRARGFPFLPFLY
jgi:hypothetical protein